MIMNIKSKTILKIFVIISFIFTLITNILATSLPLNGQTTAEISDSFPVFFVPAGYVFAIWGVIYTLLLMFTVYQALPKINQSKLVDFLRIPFIITNLANGIWIVFWHYNQTIGSLLVMVLLLITLIFIYVNIKSEKEKPTWEGKLFIGLPFSVYLGWITVATIANATVVLYQQFGSELVFTGQAWASILILIAGALTAFITAKYKDMSYVFVIFWAILGIQVKFPTETSINIACGLILVGLLILIISLILENTKFKRR